MKEGLSGLEQLLKCDPDHADASRTIGLVHWQLWKVALHFFDRSTVVKYLEMALKHDPNNSTAQHEHDRIVAELDELRGADSA